MGSVESASAHWKGCVNRCWASSLLWISSSKSLNKGFMLSFTYSFLLFYVEIPVKKKLNCPQIKRKKEKKKKHVDFTVYQDHCYSFLFVPKQLQAFLLSGALSLSLFLFFSLSLSLSLSLILSYPKIFQKPTEVSTWIGKCFSLFQTVPLSSSTLKNFHTYFIHPYCLFIPTTHFLILPRPSRSHSLIHDSWETQRKQHRVNLNIESWYLSNLWPHTQTEVKSFFAFNSSILKTITLTHIIDIYHTSILTEDIQFWSS